MFIVKQENAAKFGTKNGILHIFYIIKWILMATWSETYFRQDLFPAYLFIRRQFHAIVIFRPKLISDLDSGSLPRFFGEFIYTKLKSVLS